MQKAAIIMLQNKEYAWFKLKREIETVSKKEHPVAETGFFSGE
jgi:hypothetical protein